MRILIEMAASKDWLNENHVYSADLTTGVRILSKCRVEYAWNPSKCSHCKVYGHKDSNCGILLAKQANEFDSNSKDDNNKEKSKVNFMEILMASIKKVDVDEEGFHSVVKNNKGKVSGENPKEERGKKKHSEAQGYYGNSQSNGKKWVGTNYGNQRQNGNKFVNSGTHYGGKQGDKGKGQQGHNGNIQSMSGNSKDLKID